jgi:predicted permease
MPFTIALIEIEKVERRQLWRVPITALAAVLRNPVVMSVLLGSAVALLGVNLPSLLDGLVVLVKGVTVPCALFAMGAALAGLPLSERVSETSVLVALKLFAYPFFMYLAMALLPDVDPVWRSIAVLSAAMPMGANVYLIAARYRVYEARSSTAVLLSTMSYVITVSFLALILAEGPLTW